MITRRGLFKVATGGTFGVVLSGLLRGGNAAAQPEAGTRFGWVGLADPFGSGTEGHGASIYDLTRAEYHVTLLHAKPETSYSVYLVELRPPEDPAGTPLNWGAWGGPDTGALEGDDGKFLRIGEIRTNGRGDGVLSVTLGEESSDLVDRFNMIGLYEGRRSSGQTFRDVVLACNGDFYGVVSPSMEG